MTSESECSFENCGRPTKTRGLCRQHYRQFLAGKPLQPIKAKLPNGSTAVDALGKYTPLNLPPTACWKWTGPAYPNGYGVIHVPGRTVGYAHRVAWEIANGREPTASEHVRHLCDVRLCVNPRHLMIGTREENMREMVVRDRSVRGERNGMQRIPPGIIHEVRRLAANGEMQKDIAAEFGISRPYVSEIVRRKRWTHI